MAELEAWLDAGKALGDVEQKRRELGEGRSLVFSARVGSASDRLFSEDSTVVSACSRIASRCCLRQGKCRALSTCI